MNQITAICLFEVSDVAKLQLTYDRTILKLHVRRIQSRLGRKSPHEMKFLHPIYIVHGLVCTLFLNKIAKSNICYLRIYPKVEKIKSNRPRKMMGAVNDFNERSTNTLKLSYIVVKQQNSKD